MPKQPRVNFQKLIQGAVAPVIAPAAEALASPTETPVGSLATESPAASTKKQGTLKQRTRQQSLYLEVPVHDVLREIAFTERTSLHALYLEGIDAVLKRRGCPSIRELTNKTAGTIL